jgi:hypothetical protein
MNSEWTYYFNIVNKLLKEQNINIDEVYFVQSFRQNAKHLDKKRQNTFRYFFGWNYLKIFGDIYEIDISK